MTAIQQSYNQLLVDKAKQKETERANRAYEANQRMQAQASLKQAGAAQRQAEAAETKNWIQLGTGITSDFLKFLGTIIKIMS